MTTQTTSTATYKVPTMADGTPETKVGYIVQSNQTLETKVYYLYPTVVALIWDIDNLHTTFTNLTLRLGVSMTDELAERLAVLIIEKEAQLKEYGNFSSARKYSRILGQAPIPDELDEILYLMNNE